MKNISSLKNLKLVNKIKRAGGEPPLPTGYFFLVDNNDNFITDNNGIKLIIKQ